MTEAVVPAAVFALKASYRVAFSPDGKWLLTGGSKVSVVDAADGKLVRKLGVLPNEGGATFAPDGRHLCLKNPHGDVAVVDTRTWKVVARKKLRARDEGPAPAFASDALLCDVSWSGKLTVAAVPAGLATPAFEDDLGGHASALAAHRGRCAVFVERSRERSIVVVRVGKSVARALEVTCPPSTHAFFSCDLKTVILAAQAKAARATVVSLHAVKPGLPRLASQKLPQMPVLGVAWSNGRTIAVADGRRGVYLLRGETLVPTFLAVEGACAVAFSPDGEMLAVGGFSKGAVFRIADLR